MKKCLVALIFLLLTFTPCAWGNSFTLATWGLNLNGDVYFGVYGDPTVYFGPSAIPTSLPANINVSLFDFNTGLGTITMEFTSPGTYNVLGFFDLDGVPWDTDLGGEVGTPPPGLSWEIGEPYNSTIADDFWNSALLNLNLAGGGEHRDISLALGLDFEVLSETAHLHFYLSPNAPGGFYLSQTGSQGEQAYFSADVQYGEAVIPEPATLVLLGSGLLGLGARFRRK